MGQTDGTSEVVCPLQSGTSVSDRETAVRVFQGGLPRNCQEFSSLQYSVRKRESLNVRTSRANRCLLRGVVRPFSENPEKRPPQKVDIEPFLRDNQSLKLLIG